ncbi:TSC22 domain family protein 1-like [Saccostrea echinata]|uniref:TSC22 domain family protein 1-like n=1 Tax=Saccostrea echinata TaxID=191078 RepID=UPI002A7EE12F|nr:TSC22 domain family protein 1-like [Saccostrea echinata]
MASNSDKMAVTVDNHTNSPVNEENSRDENDSKVVVGANKHGAEGVHKKKTFKITSVTKNRGGSSEAQIGELDGDSLEDLDETVESHTEDASSEILDGSKYEDVGDQSPLEDNTFTTDVEAEAGKEVKDKGDQHTVTRFKVVKVETKEPFRRGRWTCRDSLDTPAMADASDTKVSTKEKDKVNSGNSSACSSVHYDYGQDEPSKNPLLIANTLNQVNDQLNELNQASALVMNQNPVNVHMTQTGQLVWSDGTQMPQSSINLAASYGMHPPPSNPNLNQMPKLLYRVPPPMGDQATIQSYINAMNSGAPAFTPGQPTVSVSQSVVGCQSQGQQQTVSVQALPNGPLGVGSQQLHISNAPVISSLPNSISVSSNNSDLEYTQSLSKTVEQGRQPPTNIQTPSLNPTKDSYSVPNVAQTSNINSPGEYLDKSAKENLNIPNNLMLNLSASQTNTDQVVNENISDKPSQDPKGLLEQEELGNPSLTPILTESAVAEAVGNISSPTKEDTESGSSTVAIDNKIEQAMDLVKSHLMYAVREEVEVLKEQIKELIEKNSQLEHENNILKAAASPETLALLAQPRQSQPPPPSS